MIQPASAVDAGLYPLVEDSGWIVTNRLPSGQVLPHIDGQRLFDAFYTPGDSVIPVIVLPRLIEQGPNGAYNWRGVGGYVLVNSTIFPAIWLNSRQIERDIAMFVPNSKPYSTLAHELGHVLLTSYDKIVWSDDGTPFLHILTHSGTLKRERVNQTPNPGPTHLVTADDVNRRYLIISGIDDACGIARTQTAFVRPVLFP